MKAEIQRSCVEWLAPWCVFLEPDGNPFHRSWHWFNSRREARDFVRDMKKRAAAWAIALKPRAKRNRKPVAARKPSKPTQGALTHVQPIQAQ